MRPVPAALRRAGVSPDVAVLRAAPFAVTVVVAGAFLAGRPTELTGLLAAACGLLALGAGVAPDSALPTLELGALVALYAVATAPAPLGLRAAAAVGTAAVLWGLHLAHAVAVPIPRGASLTPALRRHWARRYATTVACGLPVTAVATAAGAATPDATWARLAGVLAALVVAGAPLLLARWGAGAPFSAADGRRGSR